MVLLQAAVFVATVSVGISQHVYGEELPELEVSYGSYDPDPEGLFCHEGDICALNNIGEESVDYGCMCSLSGLYCDTTGFFVFSKDVVRFGYCSDIPVPEVCSEKKKTLGSGREVTCGELLDKGSISMDCKSLCSKGYDCHCSCDCDQYEFKSPEEAWEQCETCSEMAFDNCAKMLEQVHTCASSCDTEHKSFLVEMACGDVEVDLSSETAAGDASKCNGFTQKSECILQDNCDWDRFSEPKLCVDAPADMCHVYNNKQGCLRSIDCFWDNGKSTGNVGSCLHMIAFGKRDCKDISDYSECKATDDCDWNRYVKTCDNLEN